MVQPEVQGPRERLATQVATVPLVRLERICVALLLITALLPRLRDVSADFDRGVDGDRGALFAVAAVNYQRGDAAGAYPVLNLDRPVHAEQRLVYATHSPLVPLLAWNSVRVFGPEGWSTAWQRGEAPPGIELPLRLPFLAAHCLALLLLWAVAREAYGTSVGLLTLALASASAVGIQLAGLVGYENPGLATALLATLFTLRWVRRQRVADLALAGAAAALGASVTGATLAFAPALCLVIWRRLGLRRVVAFAAVIATCGLAPLVAHHFASSAALEFSAPGSGALESALSLLGPLDDDGRGLAAWFVAQWQHATTAHGVVIVAAAAIALGLRSARALSPALDGRLAGFEQPRRAEGDLPLFGILISGALLALYASSASNGAPSSQLWWLPAFSVGGALCLHQLGRLLLKLRAGLSPLVLLTLGLALPGLGVQAAWRARTRGPQAPTPAPRATGTWIAESTQPGGLIFYDRASGANRAVGYYAWRTLWPPCAPDDDLAVATALGLQGNPRYWLAPAPGSALEALAPPPAMLDDREPLRANAHWRLWRLDASAPEDI